ncbi:MAG: hypothetical protein SGI73_20555 [Chloroflexota bacterium]|nr:hypothetical protein [Chloroflexota bacterium]
MKTLAQAEQEARTLVNNWTMGALVTAWIPGSTLFLTGADLVMIRQVALAFAIPTFDEGAALTTISGTVASGIAGSLIAEGVGLIPVVGWVVKSGLMAGKAKLLGDSVVDYFKTLSPLSAVAAATEPTI